MGNVVLSAQGMSDGMNVAYIGFGESNAGFIGCVQHVFPGSMVGAVLVGRFDDEEITMEAISAAADSFNYEFVCGISRRVPRRYIQGGETVHTVHYLLDT